MARLRRSRQRRGRCRRRRSWARVHGRRALCKRSRCSWKLANPTESCAGMAKVSPLAAEPRDHPPADRPTGRSPHRPPLHLPAQAKPLAPRGGHAPLGHPERIRDGALARGPPEVAWLSTLLRGAASLNGPKARWWTRARGLPFGLALAPPLRPLAIATTASTVSAPAVPEPEDQSLHASKWLPLSDGRDAEPSG